VEHKLPTSRAPQQHFTWENLTIACTECNRRKNGFYAEFDGFLDPYIDDVLEILEHNGPVVTWKIGNVRGEIFVGTLELCSPARSQLVARKIEKIHQLQQTLERYESTTNAILKELLKRQLRDMSSTPAEFSAMVLSALNAKGYGQLLQ
jgi:restriction endonuclease Mrr